MAGRRQTPFMSRRSRSGHKPLIPIPAISRGLIFAFAVNRGRSRQKSPHQISSASCSAHPGLGMLIPCSINSAALISPSVLMITPLEPEVPMSMPKRYEVLMIHPRKVFLPPAEHGKRRGGPADYYTTRVLTASAGLPGLHHSVKI